MGRIAWVDVGLKFVVVDFGLNQPAPINSSLISFRDNLQSGELRVSHQSRGSRVIADIVTGEIRVNDLVRPADTSGSEKQR